MFEELADKSSDMLSFGEVDTSTKAGAALAAEHGWKKGDAGTVLKVFTRPESGFGTREGEWLEMDGEGNMKELYGELTDELDDSLVTVIEEAQQLQNFIQYHKRTLPKVFLFSKKTVPTALYKAMALEYEGRLDLSIIGDKDESILKQFNVNSFPSLLVMGGMKDMGDGQQQIQMNQYPGKKYQFKPINKFLSKYAGPPLAAVEVATQPAFEKACQPACLLTLVKGSESDEVLKPLAKKSAGELLKVVQIDTAKHADVAGKLGIESVPAAMMLAALPGQDGPEIQVAFNKKFEGDFTTEALADFIKEAEKGVMDTAQNGGKVAEGLEEFDEPELPTLWGEAKAKKLKPKKGASSTFNLTKTSFDSLLKTSDHVWLLLTCPGGASGCPEEEGMWGGLSKELRGIVWCATMDSADPAAPAGASSSGASVFAYKHTKKKKEEEPLSYKGEMSADKLAAWATDLLPKSEEGVDASSFETFVQKRAAAGGNVDPETGQALSMAPTAVVFVDDSVEGGTEKETAPMVRAMSYQFPDMAFGVIQVSEAKTMKNMDFGQLFKKDPPHLLLMVLASQPGPDGTQGMGLSFQPYMGQWSADKLTRFLKMHSKDEDRVLDDVGTDPHVYADAEVKPITTKLSPKDACGGARICAIALLDTYDSFHADHLAVLDSVALHQMAKVARGTESVPITWIDSANQPDFVQAFGIASLPTGALPQASIPTSAFQSSRL